MNRLDKRFSGMSQSRIRLRFCAIHLLFCGDDLEKSRSQVLSAREASAFGFKAPPVHSWMVGKQELSRNGVRGPLGSVHFQWKHTSPKRTSGPEQHLVCLCCRVFHSSRRTAQESNLSMC